MIPQEKYYNENRGPDLRREGGNHRWVVSEMWDVHHEIARRLLLGQKNVEIAKSLGISAQMVSNVRNSPVVQEHISILRGARDADTVDLAREIKEIAPAALQLLKEIIQGEGQGANASIALRARESNNMLARVGHGVPHKVQAEVANWHLTSNDIADIKRRAITNGDVVDAEVVGEQSEPKEHSTQ